MRLNPFASLTPAADPRADADLLARFRADRDEAAFAALVARHTPGVRAACRSWLRHPTDIDDAAQAAFLVLVRRIDQLRKPAAVGPWLYRTAEHCARRLKKQLTRTAPLAADPPARLDPPADDLADALHAEIARLPEHFRQAVWLCHVGGLTATAAAERLGRPRNTVLAHLSRGRAILKRRLSARGLAPAAGGLGAVPVGWAANTARAAVAVLTGQPIVGFERSVSLSQGVADAMSWTNLKAAAAVAVVLTAVLGFVAGQWAAADPARGPKPIDDKPPIAAKPAPAVPAEEKPPTNARRKEAVIKMPVGTFGKEVDVPQYGSGRITWTYHEDDRVTGVIEASVMGVEVEIQTEAEISLSRTGTIYGIVTSAKVTHLRLGGELAELQQFAGLLPLAEPLLNDLLTDLPFSYQFRLAGDRLTLHQFRILASGPNPVSKLGPLAEDFGEVAEILMYAQILGTALEGTYTSGEAEEKPAPKKRPLFRKPVAKPDVRAGGSGTHFD